MLTTSASAEPWASTRPLRGRSAIAARRRWFPRRSSGCCAHYLAGRAPEENLRAWFGRHTNEELRAHLAGEVLAPVERDLPTGRVPHGVAE